MQEVIWVINSSTRAHTLTYIQLDPGMAASGLRPAVHDVPVHRDAGSGPNLCIEIHLIDSRASIPY